MSWQANEVIAVAIFILVMAMLFRWGWPWQWGKGPCGCDISKHDCEKRKNKRNGASH